MKIVQIAVVGTDKYLTKLGLYALTDDGRVHIGYWNDYAFEWSGELPVIPWLRAQTRRRAAKSSRKRASR